MSNIRRQIEVDVGSVYTNMKDILDRHITEDDVKYVLKSNPNWDLTEEVYLNNFYDFIMSNEDRVHTLLKELCDHGDFNLKKFLALVQR